MIINWIYLFSYLFERNNFSDMFVRGGLSIMLSDRYVEIVDFHYCSKIYWVKHLCNVLQNQADFKYSMGFLQIISKQSTTKNLNIFFLIWCLHYFENKIYQMTTKMQHDFFSMDWALWDMLPWPLTKNIVKDFSFPFKMKEIW